MKRVFVILALVAATVASTGAPASAAKPPPPNPELRAEIHVGPAGPDCDVIGQSFAPNGTYVRHSLTVDGVLIASELEKIQGDNVAMIHHQIAAGLGAYVSASYDSALFADHKETVLLNEANLVYDGDCVAPPAEPYVDLYELRGRARTWRVLAVAGDWELTLADVGRFSFPGTNLDPVWATANDVGGNVFEYELMEWQQRDTVQIRFDLFAEGSPNDPIATVTIDKP